MKRNYCTKYLLPVVWWFLSGCAASAQISKSAKAALLNDPAIATGHIGISIYEPATGKYWYNYNDTKNFIPASNTKLFTLYAGMKYLGDSLVGLKYAQPADTKQLYILPTGDPTFLHPGFPRQPVLDFLLGTQKKLSLYHDNEWKETAWGNGWSWNDYNEEYMAERSPFPAYGNIVELDTAALNFKNALTLIRWKSVPDFFSRKIDSTYIIPFSTRINIFSDSALNAERLQFTVQRTIGGNNFHITPSTSNFSKMKIAFSSNEYQTTLDLLKHDFNIYIAPPVELDKASYTKKSFAFPFRSIKSQPTDSLFKPMMHRSDNFFAEQTLLMVSNEKLGYMNDEAIIDTILNTDLKDIPQKPRWVDGCGLSRYNLFTPRSFVYILDKMRTEFGMERLKNILATGGTGTLSAYYKKDSGYIFAKTGTLSNNCALSGYLVTQKGKLLLFSVLVNNYQSPATPVRRAVERFLQGIRQKN